MSAPTPRPPSSPPPASPPPPQRTAVSAPSRRHGFGWKTIVGAALAAIGALAQDPGMGDVGRVLADVVAVSGAVLAAVGLGDKHRRTLDAIAHTQDQVDGVQREIESMRYIR